MYQIFFSVLEWRSLVKFLYRKNIIALLNSKAVAILQDRLKTYGSFPVTDDKGKFSHGNGAVPKRIQTHLATERRLDLKDGHQLLNPN